MCTRCGSYICFSIFDTTEEMRCHSLHMIMCQNTILGHINARCLYGMLMFCQVIQSMMIQVIRIGESIQRLVIPFMVERIMRVMNWTKRNFKDIVMTSLVIFIELLLNAITLGGDLGIPPLSIGLGMSLITLYFAPLIVTAIVGTVVTYLLIDLHTDKADNAIRDVTPKRRIQRRLDGWSPLGNLEDEEVPESDITRMKNKIYTLGKKLIWIGTILMLCVLMAYTLQGCGPGEDDAEVDALILAYTILTYNEGIRMIVTLVMGIIIGNTCFTCRRRTKTEPAEEKREKIPAEKKNIKENKSPMIRLTVVQEVLYAMKVGQLSDLCDRLHIPKSGLKGDIVERIIKHMQTRLEPAHKEREENIMT